jgi:hypothetical protein
MEMFSLLMRLPFLPVTGVIHLAEIIADEADRQLHDPTRIRRELEEAQRQRDAGEISDEELAEFQAQAISILVPGRAPRSSEDDDRRQS